MEKLFAVKIKKNLAVLVFVLALVLSVNALDRLFCIKSSNGIIQA